MSKKKILLIAAPVGVVLLVVALLAVATGGFARPLMLNISFGAPAAQAAASTPLPVVVDPETLTGIMIDLGSKVVNLADPGGYRYLRVQLVLEVKPHSAAYYTMKEDEKKKEEQAIQDAITKRRPQIDDAIVGLLSDKTFADIFTLQGKDSLKKELCDAINQRLKEDFKVGQIYFTDFVIQ